ncbi:mini-chromosome maintenance complex-binding protein-like [Bufo gargarizans]|uniref:mini-chromosome maintenance complex-binding protein-like n=1 Tax=Bufo gargarizans TaxID=30331 RepID=UPI001CF28FA3|nr:mini-chromosome maintenance complex-binding protein-like [Bufo gargarizans]
MLHSTEMSAAPGAPDWIGRPLSLVQAVFAQNETSPDWEKKVTDYFHEKLQKEQCSRVPSLNDSPLHYLKPGGLVRFRCMIQDMFDPEFYMGIYETVHLDTGARALHLGKYRDLADCTVSTASISRHVKSIPPVPNATHDVC